MREGWTFKKLGEITNSISGLWIGKKPPFMLAFVIRNANFTKDCKIDSSNLALIEVELNQFEKKRLYFGDIIVEKSGGSDKVPVGRPVLFELQGAAFTFSNFTCVFRIKDTNVINCKFLHKALYAAYLRGETFRMQSKTTGIHNLDLKAYKNILIPVPPLSEQQRIVSELDLLSSIIEKKKAQLKEYDQLAQSIFYDMFAQYEDKTPTSNFILNLKGGKSLAGDEECKNKVLKTGAVTYDYFKCDEVKNLPKDYIPLPENLLKDGDLLISRMNTLEYVGAVAYVWKAPNNTYIPDRLWRAQINKNVNPIFLWFSLKQPKAKEQIRSLSSGTSGSMKNISIPRFLSVLVKNPPLPLQQSFASKIEAIEHQKALVQQSITETESLFNSRMDYYFD